MAIEIIDTLKQKNNGTFGLVDSNDIIGGFYQTDNITERNSIPLNRRKEGMFCWVKEEKKVFQLVDGLTNECWIEFKSVGSGGGTIIDGYAHIWIGDKPPEDKNMLWLDTNSDGILEDETDIETVKKLLNKISDLEIKISLLTKRVAYLEENGVVNPDKPNKPDKPDTPISIGLLLEDGTPLLLEDGTPLLLEEEKSEGSSNVINGILLEDNTNILLEDNTPLLLE